MFEYEGFEYSLDEVQSAANEAGVTFEQYIKDNGITEKPKAEEAKMSGTNQGAIVPEGQAPNMEYNVEPGFLGLQKADKVKDIVPKSPDEMSWTELMMNATGNLKPMLQASIEEIKALSAGWLANAAGEDASDWLFGDKGVRQVAFIDPITDKKVIYEEDPEKWKELNRLNMDVNIDIKQVYEEDNEEVGLETIKYQIDKFNKATDYNLKIVDVGGIIEGTKEGSAKKLVGGAVMGINSLITTMIPAIATRGASLYPQVAGSMYAEYNREKAKEKYGDDPDAIEKLIQNKENEFTTPMALAGLSTALEYVGLKGITKAIKNSPIKGKGLILKAWASLGEGSTEYAQSIVEAYNRSMGEGKTQDEAAADMWEAMQSEEAWESAIQGMFGAGVTSTIGAGLNKLNNVARKHTTGTVGADMDLLGILRQYEANTTDQVAKEGIQNKIKELEDQMRSKVQEANEIANELTEDEANDIITADQALENFKKNIAALNEKVKNGEITEDERAIAREGYQEEYRKQKSLIDTTLNKAKENVSAKNTKISDNNEALFKELENTETTEARKNIIKNEIFKNNEGLINKFINQNFNPATAEQSGLTKDMFASAVQEEFAVLLNTYNTNKNVPFGAYAQDILRRRKPKFYGETVTDAEGGFVFRNEASEQKGLMSEEEADLGISMQEQGARDIVKPLLSEKLKVSPELTTKVKEAVAKAFGTKLPAVADKKFGKALVDNFKNALTQEMKDFAGNNPEAFDSFLAENWKELYDMIPQETFNKRFPQFTEAKTDETGKRLREKTAEGKNIFIKKQITEQEFKDFFLSKELSASNRSNRKVKLMEVLAEEIGKDKAAEVIANPEVAQKFKDTQELLGQEVPSKFQEKIAKTIDRLEKWIEYIDSVGADIIMSDFGVIAVTKTIAKGTLRTFQTTLKATGDIAKAIDAAIKYLKDNFYTDKSSKTAEKIFKKYLQNIDQVTEKNTADLIEKISNLKKEDLREFTSKELVKTHLTDLLSNAKNKKEAVEIISRFHVNFSKSIGTIFSDYKRESYGEFSTIDKIWNKILKPSIEKYYPEVLNDFKSVTKKGRENGIYYKGVKIERYNDTKKLILEGSYAQAFLEAKKAKEEFFNIIDNIKDAKIKKAFIEVLRVDQRGLIRKMATPNFLDTTTSKSNLILEHDVPVEVVAAELIKYAEGKITKQKLESGLNNYKVNLVSKSVADQISKNGFNERLPNGVDIYNYKEERYNRKNIKDKLAKSNIEKILEPSEEKATNMIDNSINDMVSRKLNIDSKAEISDVKAKMVGQTKGKYKFYIPPSADDFIGLMYYMIRSGKEGDADLKWIKDNIMAPYAKGIKSYEIYKQQTLDAFRELKKQIRKTPSDLNKKLPNGFTKEQAVRVTLWNRKGYEIPGLSKAEQKELISAVNSDKALNDFSKQISNLLAFETSEPQDNWIGGSLTIDILEHVNEIARKEFLADFIEVSDNFFGKFNKSGELSGNVANKLRTAFGDNYIEALSDSLYRMKVGRAREFGKNRITAQITNWINNAVGNVMFFNTRSALLQQLSIVNFINWTDNNPFKMMETVTNQKQFWKDYSTIMNSEFLKQRRSGLKTDVNADDIARSAETSTNKIQSALAALLKAGFLPTQIADSHAIAIGGASFYRNRINTYLKEGLNQKEAESKAFLDFKEIAEETQQSSRPDLVSQQQASPIGRIILAFANTPMQYARLTKKAALDLVNGRGDWKTNMSKILWYGAVQNAIFSWLQQGLFALLFDDEEDEEKDQEKYLFAFNSVVDSMLRGLGYGGAIASTSKNMVLEMINQYESKRPDYTKVALESTTISPPINSKLKKMMAIGRTFTWKQEREKMRTEGFSLDNPAFLAAGRTASVFANIPADRLITKIDNLSYPLRHETELWQGIALGLGYGQWEMGLKETKKESNKPNKYEKLQTNYSKPGTKY